MNTDELMELSIVMPCLNEAKTLAKCVQKAQRFINKNHIKSEIILTDNGSTDGSQEIAKNLGVKVVLVLPKGYGNALLGGLSAARGTFIIMGDADDSYDFCDLMPLLKKLREGCDLVLGNRFKGGIKPGAMPFLHRYLGNPVLSTLARFFFKTPVHDFHCGLRGIKRSAFHKLQLNTTGMEFASEMIIKATLLDLKITEVPVALYPDGRGRPSHLMTWRDGWRHLRFLLLFSPNWLFIYPGFFLMLISGIFGALLLKGVIHIQGIGFDVHTLLYCALFILLGFQAFSLGVCCRVFAMSRGFIPGSPLLKKLFRFITLEVGIAVGLILIVFGLLGTLIAFAFWNRIGFGGLEPRYMLRLIIPAVLSLSLGSQTVLVSFFLSFLGMETKRIQEP